MCQCDYGCMLQIEVKEGCLKMGQALLSFYDVSGQEIQTLEDPVPELGHSYCLKEYFFHQIQLRLLSVCYCSMSANTP